MGGEGPYVRFNGSICPWSPYPLDDDQLDATYVRAHDFLLQRVRQLVTLGWTQLDTEDGMLACLSYTRILTSYRGDWPCHVELRLPSTASAWSDPLVIPRWKEMFESWKLFQPRKRRSSDSAPDRYSNAYLYVDVEPPLRDIFNFVQCLLPDVLVIIRIDDYSDMGEEEITQRLPSSRWVEDYAEELRPIFGEDRFDKVMQASQKSAALSQRLSSYWDNQYEVDDRDFTACDKECGYCGRCDY